MGESKEPASAPMDWAKTVRKVELARDLTNLRVKMFLGYMPDSYFSDSVLGALEGKYEERGMRAKMEKMELDYERHMGGIRSGFGSVEGYRDGMIEDYARPKFKVLGSYMSGLRFNVLRGYVSGMKFRDLRKYMAGNGMKPLGKFLPGRYLFGMPLRIFGRPYHV